MHKRLISIVALLVVAMSPAAALPEGPTTRTNGELNGDGVTDVADALYLLKHLFANGPRPVPLPAAAPAREGTIVYFVRHAEDDKSQPGRPLSPAGEARASLLAELMRDAAFTRILATHKQRAFQTVLPTANDQGLEVERLPEPGTVLPGGEVVTEDTSTSASIDPTIEAILKSPPGSRLLVAGHSSTLFAVMEGLGVPVASAENPCDPGDTSCLPCAVKACFPGGFDNIWTVSLPVTPRADAAMAHLHYGDVCAATP